MKWGGEGGICVRLCLSWVFWILGLWFGVWGTEAMDVEGRRVRRVRRVRSMLDIFGWEDLYGLEDYVELRLEVGMRGGW